MNIRIVLWVAAGLCRLLAGGGALAGQSADEGSLILTAGDREVGGETFRVALVPGGLRVSSKTVYTSVRPALEFTTSSERTETGGLAFQLAYRSIGGGGEVYAVQQRNRLTVRRVEPGTERASEVPGGATVVLLADSTFAPLLQLVPLAGEIPRSLTAVFPHSGRRVPISVRRLSGTPTGETTIEITGGLDARVVLGTQGELLRISLPALGLEAVRRQE